ncbi:MAG: TonB-dependent receptor, partial [Pseudomonadota bacterium]
QNADVEGAVYVATMETAEDDEASRTLGTVVVVAQKRAENLQDVPAAVSAFTPDELQSRGIGETSDLMGSLPNIQVTSAYGRTQPNFSVRGISVANEFSASTASPVGVYVDEVYQGFRASHGQQLFDLANLEVLRGPQGTLYGRNTTGGAVNIFTRKPELDGTNGYFTVGAGNFESYTAGGAVEFTPAQDVFGVRLAGTWSESDGYTENPFDGLTYGGVDSIAGRLSLRWDPGSDTSINAKVYFAENDPRQDLPYGIGYLDGGTNGAGVPLRAGLAEDDINADTAGFYKTTSEGLSISVDQSFGDNWSTTIVFGAQTDDYELSPFDCDGSALDVCAIEYFSESDSWNFDARVAYEGERLTFIGGAYAGNEEIYTRNQPDFFGFLQPLLLGAGVPGEFFNPAVAVGNSLGTLPAFTLDPTLDPTDPANCAAVVVNPNGYFDARSLIAFNTDVALTNTATGFAVQSACASAPPFANILVDQEFTLERPSQAIYGEVKYDVTDRFAVTLGLRYTDDEVKYKDALSTVANLNGDFVAALVPYTFDPAAVAAGTPIDRATAPRVNQEESTGEFSGRLVLDYQLTDDILTYASYSRGYRAGTFNGLAYQDISQVFFVDPEEVDAYEVGFKSRFNEDKMQLNAAAFFYDYQNQQIAEIVGATSFLRSVGGEVLGFEAEFDWQATDTLLIDAAFGYLDTKYDANQVFTPGGLDVGGNAFPNAPELTFNAGASWIAWEDGDRSFTLRGDAQYMGDYWFDPFNDYGQSPCDQPAAGRTNLLATPEIACQNPGYWLFNGRATYETDQYAVSAWVKNAGDEFYYIYGLNLNAFYQDYLTRGAPRTYGIEATMKF